MAESSLEGYIAGIDHVGIAVPDFEAAVATYRDVLGFDIEGTEDLPDRGLKVAFVSTGGESKFELLGATREDSEVSRFLAKRGGGIHHICLKVKDIEGAIEGLKARGARLINEVPQTGAHGMRVAFLHPKGTEGVLIELAEKGSTHG